ncbi:hypothetical protein FRC11_014819, partial [Ceratobasidium sp. 423]
MSDPAAKFTKEENEFMLEYLDKNRQITMIGAKKQIIVDGEKITRIDDFLNRITTALTKKFPYQKPDTPKSAIPRPLRELHYKHKDWPHVFRKCILNQFNQYKRNEVSNSLMEQTDLTGRVAEEQGRVEESEGGEETGEEGSMDIDAEGSDEDEGGSDESNEEGSDRSNAEESEESNEGTGEGTGEGISREQGELDPAIGTVNEHINDNQEVQGPIAGDAGSTGQNE